MSDAVFQRLRAAVVSVRAGLRGGTGWIATLHGLVVTNAHVVGYAREVKLADAAGREVAARVVFADVARDLAFLAPLESRDGDMLPLGDSQRVYPGQPVIVFGHPLGLSYTLTRGVISAVDREFRGVRYLQTDAAINPGNSGGPLVDERGQVLGVSTFIRADAQNLGFALPTSAFVLDLAQFDQPLSALRDRRPTYACAHCGEPYDPTDDQCLRCGAPRRFVGEEDLAALELPFAESERIVQVALEAVRMGTPVRSGPGVYEVEHPKASLRVELGTDGTQLFAICPIAELPGDRFAELYRFLLTANDRSVGGASLGVHGTTVVAQLRQPTAFMSPEELTADLADLARLAAHLRVILAKAYGCAPARPAGH